MPALTAPAPTSLYANNQYFPEGQPLTDLSPIPMTALQSDNGIAPLMPVAGVPQAWEGLVQVAHLTPEWMGMAHIPQMGTLGMEEGSKRELEELLLRATPEFYED